MKSVVDEICEKYDIKCKKMDYGLLRFLEKMGVIRWSRYLERWVPANLILTKEKFRKLERFLEKRGIYVFFMVDALNRLYIISVDNDYDYEKLRSFFRA